MIFGKKGEEAEDMFEWNTKLYMDETVRKKPEKYKRLISGKKLKRHCYVLTLPLNEENCLDIYSSREFWFRYYHKREMKVVGIAVSRESAEALLCEMVQDIYREYRDVDAGCVKRFFDVPA